MLKFIHCADIHLGSKIEAKLPRVKVEQRRSEVRATFHRMVEYARENGVCAILMSGDVFDSDRPLRKDKEFFYNVVRENPDIDFLYLRGNHDSKESYSEEGLSNLKTFSSEWTSYSYGDVDITGIELVQENSLSLYSTLSLDRERKNIVMLHGTAGEQSGDGFVSLRELKNRNIDYLALGHYHSYKQDSLDIRGTYAYSGCLEGRGFDETGEKGFVLLEVDEKINAVFVPFALRTIRELFVDVGDCSNAYKCYKKICETQEWNIEDLLRVNLCGEITFENDGLVSSVEEYLSSKCYFASVKDKTSRHFDIEALEGDLSLRGEFIRTVLLNTNYSDEEKHKIIVYGLRALEGREVD